MVYDPRVLSFDITPDVFDGVVTLRGTVDNLKAKRAAAQDARNTVGVWRIDNRIKVRPQLSMSDEIIKKDISNAMIRDPYLNIDDVTVKVSNGVVRLSGTVDNYFEKMQADDLSARVNGVILADNNLKVLKVAFK